MVMIEVMLILNQVSDYTQGILTNMILDWELFAQLTFNIYYMLRKLYISGSGVLGYRWLTRGIR